MTRVLNAELFVRLRMDYGVPKLLRRSLVVDSDLPEEDALQAALPGADAAALHRLIKPFLVVLPVLYRGLEDDRTHFGQIVVHRQMRATVESLFEAFYRTEFRIARVVPASTVDYDATEITSRNLTVGYLPKGTACPLMPDHAKGWALDINPLQNPLMIDTPRYKLHDPQKPMYAPGAPGVLTRDSVARECITRRELEWGGNWGDVHADPPDQYLASGFLAYRHIEPNDSLRDRLKRDMPEGW